MERFTLKKVVVSTSHAERFFKDLKKRKPELYRRIVRKFGYVIKHVNNNTRLHKQADIVRIGSKQFYVFKVSGIEILCDIDFSDGVIRIVDVYELE